MPPGPPPVAAPMGGPASAPPPPIPGAPQVPPQAAPQIDADTAMLLVHAMIAAAKADGEVDAAEMQNILGRLEQAGISPEERAFLMTELTRPLDLDGLVAKVTNPALAPEVYAASLLAITVDTPDEEAYLRTLAEKLQLDAATVAHLHQQFNAPMPT